MAWWTDFWFDDKFNEKAYLASSKSYADTAYYDLVEIDERLAGDMQAQALMYTAMYDFEITALERDYAYQSLVEYLNSEYDIAFADVFDWEAYREWYGQ